jgi:hypothetical protein
MTNDNIVPMPTSPLAAAPVIIDDSRLQTLWDRQHRRQNWIIGGCAATALLIAGALVVMAFRINAEPPKVEVAAPVFNLPEQPAPVVNVTVPPGPAPVVNVTVPSAPTAAPAAAPQPLRTGESKVITEHTIFHEVTVGNRIVKSGWTFHSSNDAMPYRQFCYTDVNRTGTLWLAIEGKTTSNIDVDARTLGVDPAEAQNLVKSCRWYTAELRDPTR